ncbi:MAG: hypothetical protein U0R77_12620 [Mycolicibacterium insubricum]|nr:hypothetical protein [Mycobacterium sp.]
MAAPFGPPVGPTPSGVLPGRSRRTRWTLVAVAVAVILVAAGIAVAWWKADSSDTSSATSPAAHVPRHYRQTVLPFHDLKGVEDVAVSLNGDVYVADEWNNRIVMLADGTGEQTVVPFIGLDSPMGVAVDAAGTVYVADTNHHRVLALPAGSDHQTELPFTGLLRPSRVAVDAAGAVYVISLDIPQIYRLAPGETRAVALRFTDSRSGGRGVAVDNACDVYVGRLTNTVVKASRDTDEHTALPFTGIDQLSSVAVGPDGTVYASGMHNNQVLELAPGADEQTVVPAQGLNVPTAVAVDTVGNVYIADFGNDRIVRMQADPPVDASGTSPATAANCGSAL